MEISNEEWEAFKGSKMGRCLAVELKKAQQKVKDEFFDVMDRVPKDMVLALAYGAKGTIEGYQTALELELGDDE